MQFKTGRNVEYYKNNHFIVINSFTFDELLSFPIINNPVLAVW